MRLDHAAIEEGVVRKAESKLDDEFAMDVIHGLDFFGQFKMLAASEFKTYRPGCVNNLRLIEVASLGALVGLLFYDVGNRDSGESLGQKTGLLFFSVTLWTFTRMYPSVGTTNGWFKRATTILKCCPNHKSKM